MSTYYFSGLRSIFHWIELLCFRKHDFLTNNVLNKISASPLLSVTACFWSAAQNISKRDCSSKALHNGKTEAKCFLLTKISFKKKDQQKFQGNVQYLKSIGTMFFRFTWTLNCCFKILILESGFYFYLAGFPSICHENPAPSLDSYSLERTHKVVCARLYGKVYSWHLEGLSLWLMAWASIWYHCEPFEGLTLSKLREYFLPGGSLLFCLHLTFSCSQRYLSLFLRFSLGPSNVNVSVATYFKSDLLQTNLPNLVKVNQTIFSDSVTEN